MILDLDVTLASAPILEGECSILAISGSEYRVYVMLWLDSCLIGFATLLRYGGFYRGIGVIG